MPSSTSASRRGAGAAWCLLLGIVLVIGAAEAAFRYGFDRSSRIQARIAGEYQGALWREPEGPRHRRRLLMLGNSLLLEGVDFPRLAQGLLPEIEARRFVVDNTFYFDWYYGVRRLLHRGARPDVIALAFSPRQFVSSAGLGDYSAHLLIDGRDLGRAAGDLNASPTAASNLVYAHFSKFYAVRGEFRKWVLLRLMPDFPRLGSLLTEKDFTRVAPAVRQRALGRLRALRAVADEYGVRLVLIIMPLPGAPDGVAELQDSGKAAAVTVLVPDGPFTFAEFKDGFHLKPEGAARFTGSLTARLRQQLLGAE